MTKETLRTALLGLGFDAVRFASADSPAPGAAALDSWLAAGMQADMAWLERNAPRRKDPSLVLPGVRSVVLLGVNYLPAADAPPEAPVWARYSLYRDYHDTITPALAAAGRLLEQSLGIAPGDHRYYVDTGPVMERGFAAAAGLGFVGKNAMLISRDFGNWLFLGAILTRAFIEPDAPLTPKAATAEPGALCGKCTRCLEACPTRALVGPGVLDARRCISYLTIENKGPIPLEFRPLIGAHVYGCDICAEVCPWNRFAVASRSVLLEAKAAFARLSLGELLSLDAEGFARVFKGTAVKRIKRSGLLRNACVVAGNSADTRLLPLLDRLAGDASETDLVREHASWGAARLRGLP